MNVTDTNLEPISLYVSLIQPQWSSSFSSNESQFLCLECFPAFQRVDSLSFKARLKFLSRFFISFWAFNTIWKSCICLFLCFLALLPYTQHLTRYRGLFQPAGVNSLNAALLSPYQTPTQTPTQNWIRKREASAVQPGRRSQSHPEASRLENGNSKQCSWGRYQSLRVKREKPTLTQIWYPTPELQTQEGESRE